MTTEMHPSRWGDPAAATDLPDAARGLIEMAFGIEERPAAAEVTLPVPAIAPGLLDGLRDLLGAEHVLTDDETRRLRTRGKSTPDLLRQRAGDLSDAPDAVVRPGTHEEVAAVLAYAVEHHLAVVPFGGGTSVTGGLVARREGYAGLVSLDLIRMKRLVAVDHTSMTATLEPGLRGPGGRGAAGGGGADPGPLPPVVRVREHRRLRGHPVQRPVQRRLRPLRRPRRAACGSPLLAASCGSAAPPRTPPAPTCGS